MQPVFTVSKEVRRIDVDLIPQLHEFCNQIYEWEDSIVVVPNPGKLYHVLALLKNSKVEYDLTFPEQLDFNIEHENTESIQKGSDGRH